MHLQSEASNLSFITPVSGGSYHGSRKPVLWWEVSFINILDEIEQDQHGIKFPYTISWGTRHLIEKKYQWISLTALALALTLSVHSPYLRLAP